jgi:hypothetical protein
MPRPGRDDHTDELVVRLRLTCLQPPRADEAAPTAFGLQGRAGNVHPGQEQPDGSVVYEVALPVVRRADGAVRFLGPSVHGTPAAPFLYLSLKRVAPEARTGTWVKRLKVPLPALAWNDVAAPPGGLVFAAAVSGTRSGTIPLLDRESRPDAPG